MRPTFRTILALILVAWTGGCGSNGLPTLPAPPLQTASTAQPSSPGATAPLDTAIIVLGTPTDVYAQVARGALGCWFGADGVLKGTHVFHADAAPPSRGGAAEITVHERDTTLRDSRGPRALRISIEAVPGGVRVVTTTIKIFSPLAELMTRDADTWARGGVGCQAHIEPEPSPVPGATVNTSPPGARRR